jgi:hypothetical protein
MVLGSVGQMSGIWRPLLGDCIMPCIVSAAGSRRLVRMQQTALLHSLQLSRSSAWTLAMLPRHASCRQQHWLPVVADTASLSVLQVHGGLGDWPTAVEGVLLPGRAEDTLLDPRARVYSPG